ncbi:MAG: 2-oxoglutarate dehydrogenase E1 component [Chloroflexi bacterium]|nr:2-oxoglutarate dehydrogenase E1 component [Chloroflexota bacterium]
MIDLSAFPGPNSAYVLDLYEQYRKDPQSVDDATRAYFEDLEKLSRPSQLKEALPASLEQAVGEAKVPASEAVRLAMGATSLALTIREYGYLAAHVDPLGTDPPGDPDLEPAAHHILEEELITLAPDVVPSPAGVDAHNALEVIQRLRQIYCGPVGYDFSHVQNAVERSWLLEAIETGRYEISLLPDQEEALLERLTRVEVFEQYLQQTYRGKTRFSIEGLDILVPMLDELLAQAGTHGTADVLIGMAHRGRLNVLAHVLGRPYAEVLADFETSKRGQEFPISSRHHLGWTGDVKYHEGGERIVNNGDQEASAHRLTVHLAPNPSHLEFVDPVVEGRTRAAQESRGKPGSPIQDVSKALAILVHGDASFTGQGIVAETLNFSRLQGYATGGTVHIIANNQIGFTTEPSEGRSTLHASDLAKGFEIPVFHVNADNPIACLSVARLAIAYRYTFHKDVLIDLVGYRRLGHNEGDEPSFTQPLMYEIITHHPTLCSLYATQLLRQNRVVAEQVEQIRLKVRHELEQAVERVRSDQLHESGEFGPVEVPVPESTGVRDARLRELNTALFTLPSEFGARIARIIERRREALNTDAPIDWGHAELLALASILDDDIPVRLTGQDSQRGTFGQRHAVIHDMHTGRLYCPLEHLPGVRVSAAVYNSPLSEAAVLGFEYGYSIQAPNVLVIWEAQYGDFINSAQVIVDEFVVSGFAKWAQTPSLVLLLPHGYEGAGPDHSSARIERFLRMCANNNIRVASCTTAAQYFHLLRLHAMLLDTAPQPLVIFSPKSLLRHPKSACRLHDLVQGSFQPVLDDPMTQATPENVRRILFCSGKIFVDLDSAPQRALLPHMAILRIEQLYPVPEKQLYAVLKRYPRAQEVVWVQEEPENMGALPYYAPIIQRLVAPLSFRAVARPPRVSPAEGSPEAHRIEQERIVREALHGDPTVSEAQREVIHAR